MVKICFISLPAYALFNKSMALIHGGSEFQLFLISNWLARDDKYRVSFIVGDFGQKKIEYYNKIQLWRFLNIKISKNFFLNVKNVLKYFLILKKVDADIFFISTPNSMVGFTAFFCKLTKRKMIFRTGTDSACNFTYIKEKGILGKVYQYGLENSDAVISQNLEQYYNLKKFHRKKSYLIRNIVKIPKSKKRKRREFILWVSRYDSMKHPEIFLRLSQSYPKEKFVIICNPNDNYIEDYKRLKLSLKNYPNVEFIEKVSFNEIQDYYDKAKIFINTSTYEGFPNTFIQAGIAGTPILSLLVNPDKFITKFNCGYACNNDIADFTGKMNNLLSDKKDWEEKSKNLREYTIKYHDIEENSKKIKKLIDGLAK